MRHCRGKGGLLRCMLTTDVHNKLDCNKLASSLSFYVVTRCPWSAVSHGKAEAIRGEKGERDLSNTDIGSMNFLMSAQNLTVVAPLYDQTWPMKSICLYCVTWPHLVPKGSVSGFFALNCYGSSVILSHLLRDYRHRIVVIANRSTPVKVTNFLSPLSNDIYIICYEDLKKIWGKCCEAWTQN